MLSAQGRRVARHAETAAGIVAAAWELAEEHGIAGVSVGTIAAAMGMRPQSLYHYFPAKDAIYDRMYREGFEEYLQRLGRIPESGEPVELLCAVAEDFVDFAAERPGRYQLLFQRTIPGFTPSPESYGVALRALDELRRMLRRAGISRESDVDLWRALLLGLAGEQLANDPGGRRWRRLARRTARFFVGYVKGTKEHGR